MKEAKTQKKIGYVLGYSNFTFELWMVLHKRACNGSLTHRRQYLAPISDSFGEKFEDLDHYKREDAFTRCLNKLDFHHPQSGWDHGQQPDRYSEAKRSQKKAMLIRVVFWEALFLPTKPLWA